LDNAILWEPFRGKAGIISELIVEKDHTDFIAALAWGDDAPVCVRQLAGSHFAGRRGVALVQIFTAEEQRGRTSQAYVRSAIGDRLRYTGHEIADDGDALVLTVNQVDPQSGLQVSTAVSRPDGVNAYRFQSVLTNASDCAVTLTAISSLTVGFGQDEADLEDVVVGIARSEWLAENRWEHLPVRLVLPELSLGLHGQDGRGHFGLTSHGAWSSGEYLPAGTLERNDGQAMAWQIETSVGWHWDLAQMRDGGVLSLMGPTDLEHQFAVTLEPGDAFTTVPVAVGVANAGAESAVAELTQYRRWLRRRHGAVDDMPLVYNDFMNTLMGQPSTEALLPLVRAAAAVGAECFCIDAGWYADPASGDWWASVGEWSESSERFTDGLGEVIAEIHSLGMRSGIWLEPEVIGVHSPVARSLPESAFFHRFGKRVREHDRFHLDFRHPAARQHLDRVVDRLIAVYGISYFKLDYNINPGAGTSDSDAGAGAGLLGHARAYADWIGDLRKRHPEVSIENCSSGAMRADYSLLAVTQLQSTSDQQDFTLYPPVAASAPATIVPEQCGNWAYPSAAMNEEEIGFALTTGLAGRLYLSGFLHELSPAARSATAQAAALYKSWRSWLARSTPFWPLGLPGWDDDAICLGLSDGETTRLFVWDRSDAAREITLPIALGHRSVSQLGLGSLPAWDASVNSDAVVLRTPAGCTARILELQ